MRVFSNFGAWLYLEIQKTGLTVNEFAATVGLSKSQVYRYFTDDNRPSDLAMDKMCAYLGLRVRKRMKLYKPKKVGRPSKANLLQKVLRSGRSRKS